ncbi:MAG: oligosaccharide flippase family protein [Actinomycetota bacterium]|nr:oligosaccharide flippase family protein [Actinomycetota bacterium]
MSQPEEKRLSTETAADIKVVAKGGAVQLAGQVTQRLLSFGFGAIFTRILGPGAYGLYRQVSQILANSSQVGLAGFNYGAMRFITSARARGDHAAVKGSLRVSLLASGMASIIVFAALLVFADTIAAAFADTTEQRGDFARLIRLGAAYVPLFALLQVLRYATQAYKTMVPSVTAGNIVQPIARFMLGVTVLVLGFDVAGAVVSLTVSVGLAVLVIAWYLRRMLTEEERAAKPAARVGPLVRFALPQAGASLLGIQTLGLGILLLGALSTDEAAGYFAIALSLQGPGNVFLGGIVNIWAPVVSDLHEKREIARLDSLYKTINRWIATFSFPVFAALILEPDVFVLFYGEDAAGAIPVVALLAIGNIFYTGTGPTGYVISMTGHPGVNFANSAVAVALYIGLGYLVVPRYGVVGMAVVDLGVTAAINLVRVIEAKLLVGVQPFGRNFIKPVVATAVAAGVLLASRVVTGDRTLLEVAAIAVAAVVYVVTLKVLGLDEEERLVWKRIRKRAFKRGGGQKSDEGSGG